MGQATSSLVQKVVPGASLAHIVAEADLPDVQRALEACPQKICASLRGSLGTPIHVAAAHGRAECVQLLVQQATALALASSKYDPNNQRMFVAYRMVNTGNDRKQTPLMLAAGQGHEQCVGLLLDLGADRWAADTLGGRTALHYAARLNQPQVVTALLKGAGPSPAPAAYPNTINTLYVNAKTMAGFTPLHLAVHAGALEAAAALLRAGATLTGRTIHDGEGPNCAVGSTPLHLAAQRGDFDMVLLLLTAWAHLPAGSRDADLRTLRDSDGHLPARVASSRCHRHLAPLLDADLPLSGVLADNSGGVVLGPPRLARLASDVLRAKVTAALEAAESAVGTKAKGSCSSSSCCSGSAPAEVCSADCPVCLEPLGPGRIGVVLVPCRHTLCLACCREMHQVLAEATDATRCPLCRAGVGDIAPLP